MRRLWSAAVLALSFVLLTPGAALAARPPGITHGLDFLHAKQRATGGFSQSAAAADACATPWAILAIVAGGESPSQWKSGGKSPIAFLQSLDLETVALASQPYNPPAYYAKCILAYRAAGQLDKIYNAGTGHLDLITKMNAYNGALDGDGHYSPQTSGSRNLYSISTTGWAILALKAAGESGSAMTHAVAWLQTRQYADGGFATQPGLEATDENTEDTALAVLALHAGAGSATVVDDALAYLTARQLANAGFQYTKNDDHAYAESTSWAIQARMAADGNLAGWTKGSATPLTFLRSLQKGSGAYQHRKGVPTNALSTTAVSLIGYSQNFLPVLPVSSPKPPKWLPAFTTFAPGGGALFHTRSVTVVATYHDTHREGETGTGINPKAIRITVDGKGKTGAASVFSYKLVLKLTNLSNGQHTVSIKIVDQAGNSKTVTHKFTVHVNTPAPPPTTPPPTTPPATTPPATHLPPTTSQPPTTITPPTTILPSSPNPYQTNPYFTGSPLSTTSGYPWQSGSPSPSTSGSPVPGGTSGGGGWGPTLLGIVLVSLVPIGATASYLARRRMSGKLDGAAHGKVLAGGGSAWQRLFGRKGGGAAGGTTAASE